MNKTNNNSISKNNNNIKFLAITGVFTALVYVFTAFVNIRLPLMANGGLIHLGNIPLFICAIVFGKKSAAIAGGIGMALFDILSAWTIWAPFTFVIVGTMGFVMGLIIEKLPNYKGYVLGMIAAMVIKIAGYYIAEIIIYQNAIVPLSSVPGNFLQMMTAIIIVLPLAGQLAKLSKRL